MFAHGGVEPTHTPPGTTAATEQADGQGAAAATHGSSADDNSSAPLAPRVGVGVDDGSGHREESAPYGNPSRGGGVQTPRRDRGHASVATHDAPETTAAVDAGETPVTTTDPIPLRTPTTKPKVKLERDNPWP